MRPTETIEGHNSIDDTIRKLIAVARPEGDVFRRLERYEYMISQNIFIGEAAMRFIADLVDKYNAAIVASKQEQK